MTSLDHAFKANPEIELGKDKWQRTKALRQNYFIFLFLSFSFYFLFLQQQKKFIKIRIITFD